MIFTYHLGRLQSFTTHQTNVFFSVLLFPYNNSLSISLGLIMLPCCPLVYLLLCLLCGALLSCTLASDSRKLPCSVFEWLEQPSDDLQSTQIILCVLQRLPYLVLSRIISKCLSGFYECTILRHNSLLSDLCRSSAGTYLSVTP